MADISNNMIQDDFAACLVICRQAFDQILPVLDLTGATAADPDAFYDLLQKARQDLGGWDKVGQRLGLNDPQMTQFTHTLRIFRKLLSQHDSQRPASHNLLMAALRFVNQLERLKEQQPLFSYATELHQPGEKKQLRSQQQVRALELMIRSLINQAYRNQQTLVKQLRQLFGNERVQSWLKAADRDDILSGTLFSELASLFVDKKEYTDHYSALYHTTPLLSLMNDKRKTLQTYLEDIRYIRNRLAHHKRVTTVQTALLDRCYHEIAEPVQEAFDDGRVSVNPDGYFDAGEAEVRQYFLQAAEKIDRLGDDIQHVRESLERHDEKLDDIKQDTGLLRKKMVWVLTGIAALAIGSLLIFGTSTKTLVNTEAIRSDLGEVGKTVAGVKKESSSDPRKELANIGISWEEKNLRSAIERGDNRVVGLFLDGGMPWKLYYTQQALAEDNHPGTLELLLQHKSLMDEPNGCEGLSGSSMLRTLSNRDSLTPSQVNYLKAFCSSSADVQLIKGKLATAVSFEQRQRQAYDREMAAREPANTCERRLLANNAQNLLADAARFSLSGSSTYSLHDALLADINVKLISGDIQSRSIRQSVKDYCVKQASQPPNIAIDNNWSKAQQKIYDVVK